MMDTRVIHTRFWQDNFICSLNHKEKLLFLYLISNDRVNISGVYELPDKYIKNDLEMTTTELEKAKEKFHTNKKFIFFNGWIKVVNIERYQNYTGEKNEVCKAKELEKAPPELQTDTLSIPYRYPIDSPSNKKSEISNKKPVIRNKKLEEVWLKVYGKELQGSKTYVDEPLRRLLDAYGLEKVCGLFIWAEQNRKDNKYIAVIRHPKDLEDKWNSLINQYNKTKGENEFRDIDLGTV